MGKGGSTGISDSVSSGLQGDADALTKLAMSQASQSSQLFNLGLPGIQKATEYYGALASGDPWAIFRATAPIAQSADTAAAAAKANILNNGPAGGEKTLALEQVDVNRGKQVGDAATSGFTGAFNALASLGGQNVGQSQGAAGLGISGLNAGSSSLASIGNFQLEGQQLQAEQKGNSLGALSSLGAGIAGLIGDTGTAAGATGLAAFAV